MWLERVLILSPILLFFSNKDIGFDSDMSNKIGLFALIESVFHSAQAQLVLVEQTSKNVQVVPSHLHLTFPLRADESQQ